MKKFNCLLLLFGWLILPVLSMAATQAITPISSANNAKQELSNQLAATITAAEYYQQQLQTRLQQLQQQNVELKQQLVAVNQRLQQVTKQSFVTPAQTIPITDFWQQLTSLTLDNPMIDLRFAVGLMAVGLLLLAWFLWSRRPNLATQLDQQIGDEEYDFMGSIEAIPAKLDLARAYVEMGKLAEAKEKLREVITKGNNAQRKEAEQILQKMLQ